MLQLNLQASIPLEASSSPKLTMDNAIINIRINQFIKSLVSILDKMQDKGHWMTVEHGLNCLMGLLHGHPIDDTTADGDMDLNLVRQCNELTLKVPPPAVKSALYWSPCYSTLSDMLLSLLESASDEWPRVTAMTRQVLDEAPAAASLSTLLSTITCVSQSPAPSESNVKNLGADQAAEILTDRFFKGEGVEELVLCLAYQANDKGWDEEMEVKVDATVGSLLSLHENVPFRSEETYTNSWLSRTVNTMFVFLCLPEGHWSSRPVPIGLISKVSFELLATMIRRACTRGHSREASKAILDIYLQGHALEIHVQNLMAELTRDSRCLEKIAAGLLSAIVQRFSLDLPAQPEDQYCLIRANKLQSALEPLSSLAGILGGKIRTSSSQEMIYCLIERMILGCATLDSDELFLLTSFLGSDKSPLLLQDTLTKISKAWCDEKLLSLSSISHQGFVTHALGLLLCHLISKGPDPMLTGSFLPLLLKGVSHRLGASLLSQRRQAMRIGRLISFLTTAGDVEPLFEDQVRCGELNWTQEELWLGAMAIPQPLQVSIPPHSQPKQTSPAALKSQERLDVAISSADADSDNELSSSDGEGDGLPSYNVNESKEVEDLNKDPKALQLRTIASSLKKADDPKLVLLSLQRLESLLRCHPEELSVAASDLVRSLLHCRIPEWAEKESKSVDEDPQAQRLRCLVALTSLSPVVSGDTLLSELYSPHLDTFQRLLILDSLTQAAEEMSESPKPLTGLDDTSNGSSKQASSQVIKGPVPVTIGQTRVWGKVALRKRVEPAPGTHKNRFTAFALRWASSILRNVDVVSQGVDLLSRESVGPMVLGRVISSLASFAEYSSHTGTSLPLAILILDLLKAPQIHEHQDPYIRRAALLAAGQVLASLPPVSVAQAMPTIDREDEPRVIGGIDLSALVKLPDLNVLSVGSRGRDGGKWDAQDAALLQGLDFIQSWARRAAEDDVDSTVKAMAGACVNIQAGLAKQAMECLAVQAGKDHQQRAKGAVLLRV